MGIEPSDADAVKLRKVQQTLAPFAAVIDDLIPPVAALLSITNRPRSQHSSAIVKGIAEERFIFGQCRKWGRHEGAIGTVEVG